MRCFKSSCHCSWRGESCQVLAGVDQGSVGLVGSGEGHGPSGHEMWLLLPLGCPELFLGGISDSSCVGEQE